MNARERRLEQALTILTSAALAVTDAPTAARLVLLEKAAEDARTLLVGDKP